jgi:hypothetical protein
MAINQALSGGGLNVHGTPEHVDQGDPGATTSFGTIVFDTAGAELHVYKTWQSTVTYANWDVITGSNSLLYQSIVAGNLNHDPTTDDGTHWLAVSIPNKGTTNGHVPIWNSTSLRYEPGAIPTGSGLPVGTNAQMIINDGATPYVVVTIAGDISIVNTGVVTVSKGRGNAFPAAATVKGDIWYGSNAATLSALAGNITTTQKFLAETGTGAAANAPSWVDLTAYLLPTGTNNQTLRNNAGTWEATSYLLNKSTSIEVGSGTATANVEFTIFGTGATTPILLDVVENVSSSQSVSIRAYNSGLNKGAEMGFAAATDSYFVGTAAGDAILRATGTGAGSVWIGSVTTPIAKFDATALADNKVLATNSTGVMTIRALVAADIPVLALTKLISGGVAGKILYDNANNVVESGAGSDTQTLYMSGTTPSFSSVLTNNNSTIAITPAAANIGLTITGVSGQVVQQITGTPGANIAALQVQTDSNLVANFISTGNAPFIRLQTNVSPVSGTNLSGLLFRGKESAGSNIFTGAQILAQARETWDATHSGCDIYLQTVPITGSTTLVSRIRIHANGDVVLNASGSALATSATSGFTWMPNMAGTPTGAPGIGATGASPFIADTTAQRLMMNVGSSTWVDPSISVPVALTDAATIATDASLGKTFTVTLGGNRTLGAPTNPTNGQKIIYRIKQDATGSRTLAYNAIFRFSADIPSPTLTTTVAKTDYLGFIYNATDTKWDILAINKGI